MGEECDVFGRERERVREITFNPQEKSVFLKWIENSSSNIHMITIPYGSNLEPMAKLRSDCKYKTK